MKKIFILLLSICAIAACDNEPLDGDLLNVDNPTDPTDEPVDPTEPSDSDDLTLASYTFDVDTSLPVIEDLSIYQDYNITNNAVTSIDVETISDAFNLTTVTTIEKAGTSITSIKTLEAGTQISETNITGTGIAISQIDHINATDPTENYNYTFTQTGTTVERLKTGTTERVVFTFDGEQLTKKEVFDGATTVSIQALRYDTNGNCINNVIVGASGSTTTYGFDANQNPLKTAFNDQFFIFIYDSEASDDLGATIAQFYSTNNWNSVTDSEGTLFFTLGYNLANRIQTRSGNYSSGDGISITQNEIFTYVN